MVRFLAVGGFNTLLGYAIIVGALHLGAGDYPANVIGFSLGLPISWLLHRVLTFRVRHEISRRELVRYVLVVAFAYAVNLGVVAGGRGLGFTESPLVQLVAICVYAALFYVLSRRFVFPASDPSGAAPRSSGGSR
nr:GtrA family protein [Qipengyuania proteolytica]